MSLRVERSETKQPQGLGLLSPSGRRFANAQRIMTVNIFVHLLKSLPLNPIQQQSSKWVCKINCVIASDSEAIARLWDCFVSLRSTRNDNTQLILHEYLFVLTATNL